MTDPYADSPPLTAEQQAVVDLPWNAWTLVTAGAGAGKTHTLVRRLDALVDREELEENEILVLSFSRAAVRELRERIDRDATAARRVRVQTFDSWATSLLTATRPDGAWTAQSYADRIRAATTAVEEGAVDETEQGPPFHLIVDEVQDLVGVRREMVEALIDKYADNCGFTVVGDAAQSVYGFEIKDPDERAAEVGSFFVWLRRTFGEDLVELNLSDNFRARTEEARTALSLGADLQNLPRNRVAAEAEAERVHRDLRARLSTVLPFGDLREEFVLDSLRDASDSCAVLCRTNGQALRVSELLRAGGVPHHLQRSARDRAMAGWIAELLRSTSSSSLQQDRFTELLAGCRTAADVDPAAAWRALRKVAPGRAGTLDLTKLQSIVAEGRVPDELAVRPISSLVVSTVHRAKGLEFDRVLVLETEALRRPAAAAGAKGKRRDYDPVAEARALYVAMTRPRDDLYRLDAPGSWFIKKDERTGRWYVAGQEHWSRSGVELTAGDVDTHVPPGTDGFDADPVELQDRLATKAAAGGTATLRLLHNLPAAEDQSPPYVIEHDGRPVGVVSERFRKDLHRLLGKRRTYEEQRWPLTIRGVALEGVETAAGSAAAGARAGLGDRGVWLVPRLGGLGRFRWTDGENGQNGQNEQNDHDEERSDD
ncbi:UvrD-helicase domain-containing protein [Streptomyces sp. HB2AG]|uniref:UvrD-helicase domain-containing protein n=1 Tax=Streptomyces sp. HB2AG TaxID=2983400 RepID=UPI0022AB1A32|nr:UvrD-helicase domain-containing protein [Streptomyces sp. HB2AG]MCZ2523860.1 UvrD-helicase domain-containing protein [Streptomyces sp. HB2AG]